MIYADLARSFRKRAREGQVGLGFHVNSMSPQVVEIAGLLGLDYVVVSNEVESLDPSRMEDMLRAAAAARTVPIVKIRRTDPLLVEDAMTAGAPMVMVPHVKTRAQLDQMVHAARFSPCGKRLVCPGARYTGYGVLPLSQSSEVANSEHTVIPIIEDREAIEHLEDIVSSPDVDLVEFGPFDMGQSLGLAHPERGYDNPEILRVVEQLGALARKHDKGLIGPVWTPAGVDSTTKTVEMMMRELVPRGVNILYAMENFLLIQGLRGLLEIRRASR